MPDLLDVYEGDPWLAPAFVSLVQFVAKQEDAVASFEADSGLKLPPAPRTSLDAMIDEAAGVNEGYVMAFAAWVYETMWAGEEEDEPAGESTAG